MPGFKVNLNENLEKILNEPYAFELVEEKKKKAVEKFGKDRIIDFGVGDPTDDAPQTVRDAAKKGIEERKNSGYPTAIGEKEYREKVAEWFGKRFGVNVDSDKEVVSSFGAKQCIFLMPYHFLNSDRENIVLMPNPGYPPYKGGTTMAGGTCHFLNLLEENNFEPKIDDLDREIVEKTKIIYVNSPQNPTGKVYRKEKLKEIVDFCIDNEIILISDECYSENYYGEKPLSILQIENADQCSIVVNSLSKMSMMTSYRVGFVVIKNEELMKPYKLFEQNSHSGVATFIQDAAIAALSDEKVSGVMNKIYKERIDAFLPALKSAGFKIDAPEGTFYLWAKLPEGETPIEYSTKLLEEKGINCTPGNMISETFNGVNPGDNYVRFAMVAPLEKTKEAAERLLE
ncbi:MAG: aminotransferase class I/II-fold pyridoxal phosphate-dependent enzyme [Candidatus Diapherotrites archaeon]